METPPRRAGASLELEGVSRRYAGVAAVDGVSLSVRAGEFLTLLGSSGCGKTTTLMMIAGFDTPSAGEIRIDGRPVTRVPPHLREQGFVFQHYALFPHMTVRQNLAFPLETRGMRAAERAPRIERMLERLGLRELGDRLPAQLSGGQQQRTALARALIHDPPLLLMDEPLAALDRRLRMQLQGEIKTLQREFSVTVVYVTHDQEEALSMSDRIAVMNRGRIEQIAPPEEIYARPANEFVASFLGEANVIEGMSVATPSGLAIAMEGWSVTPSTAAAMSPGIQRRFVLRPERLQLTRGELDPSLQWAPATVLKRSYLGECEKYRLQVGSSTLVARRQADGSASFGEGEQVSVGWRAEDIGVLSA